ncbi:hypothetical protein LTR78_004031 [Recurvomyces mirabilis]|uniref:DUF2428 domain-containing protein n=1 Tax=Recurvomyces mirabilis TaxID=574656 RepID=A0AAE0WQS4_9PEZI|nr:hypothetical protein LTR78_004031 [Recurvomyces mirabilis]KAK5153831.1 hypothetical protein LTS14_007050 [Recurvomyces mirabilis]
MTSIADGVLVQLDEAELKSISRNIRTLFVETPSSDDVIKIEKKFDNILKTAQTANLAASHKVAAWNALCACIDRCSQQPSQEYAGLIWSSSWWSRAFDLYISQAYYARPKSARQLLDTLTSTLQPLVEDEHQELDIRGQVCHRLIAPLLDDDDSAGAKIPALALAHMLGKDALSSELVLRTYSSLTNSDDAAGEIATSDFLCTLFRWMSNGDFSAAIGRLVSIVLDKSTAGVHEQVNGHDVPRIPVWATALCDAIRHGSVDVDSFRAHLLPPLFQRNAGDYKNFLYSAGLAQLLGDQSALDSQPTKIEDFDLDLLLASLQSGKDTGLLQDTDRAEIDFIDNVVGIPVKHISKLLHCNSSAARLTGLSLLTTSPAVTRPLLSTAVDAIKHSLIHFLTDTDADVRSELFSIFQRLIDRIRAVTAVLARQADETQSGILQHHKDFLAWLLTTLHWELRPTASYQTHISALRCLMILAKSGLDESVPLMSWSRSATGDTKWPFRMSVLDKSLRSLLLDLTLDPFDDVRQCAAMLLGLGPTSDTCIMIETQEALAKAEAVMLLTGRADQADGVAHLRNLLYKQSSQTDAVLLQLVDRLVQMLDIAKADLSQAVDRYPVHGLLTSVRYILDNTPPGDEVDPRLIVCLHDVWTVVKPILCNDAPEGYLPEDMEDTSEVSTKDTLSYCWRALKEASLLTGTIVQHQSDPASSIAVQLYDLCFIQLAELRHRGAFSTVAQTWVSCCIRAGIIAAAKGVGLLQKWYQDVLLILDNKTTINTRRSAGLPSLLCGILVADKRGRVLEQAFTDLEHIARSPVDSAHAQEGSLSQVHALNCLKDVLKNGRLGEVSEQYVPRALVMAADALRSEVWAVRNCGLMLFRAVIDRLLGTSGAHLEDDQKMHKRVSAEQHPLLLEIVLDLLALPSKERDQCSTTTTKHEGVFPALQLLQRLNVPTYRLPTVQKAVYALVGSHVWHIRDKAARTYASLVPMTDIPELVQRTLAPSLLHNTTHGSLLCAKYLVRRSAKATGGGSPTLRTCVEQCMVVQYYEQRCTFSRAAYVDLLREVISTCGHENGAMLEESLSWLVQELKVSLVCGGEGAALRLALSRTLATSLLSSFAITRDSDKEILGLVLELALGDSDAGVALLHELNTRLIPATKNHAVLLSKICESVVLESSIAVAVKTTALKLLLTCSLYLDCLEPRSNTHLRHALKKGCLAAQSDQVYADLTLETQAVLLEDAFGSESNRDDASLINAVDELAISCKSAVEGHGFFTSTAGAMTIARFDNVWHMPLNQSYLKQPHHSLPVLCIATYDLLNDDDEDLRNLASTTATRLLQITPSPLLPDLLPALASQKLLAFMSDRCGGSLSFVQDVFRRAFGVGFGGQASVHERLRAYTKADTALFMREKQNLYIDETREAKLWSRAAIALSPLAIPGELLTRLAEHTQEGLAAIATQLNKAGGGPLSWTSKPEIFALILQVVYGAEVLMRLSDKGTRISVRPSDLHRQLLATSTHDGCHCLWRKEIDRVLAHAASSKLSAVHALIARTTLQAQVTAGGMSA